MHPIDPTTGNKTASNKENAIIFANHLESVHKTHKDQYMHHAHKKEIDHWAQQQNHLFNPIDTPQNLQDDDEYSRKFTKEDLEHTLKKLNYKSTPGEDTIPYTAIKELPTKAKDHLLLIYNTCFARGYFLKAWKTATGKMALKPNKPKENPGSYRPISLLNCLGKTVEKLIATRIHRYLVDNKIIKTWQRAYHRTKRQMSIF